MYRNSEYYPDPTVSSAIAHIRHEEKMKRKIYYGGSYIKWVYIASPYKGDTFLNIARAKRYSRFVAQQSYLPVCPHIYLTQFLDDNNKDEREAGLYLGIQMLKRCNELWVFGDAISDGMQKEIEFAKKHNIPIKYFDTLCKEVICNG